MDTTAHTATRLVNCYLAFTDGRDIRHGDGAYGNPAEALLAAARLTGVTYKSLPLAGIAIEDVNTGEAWLVPTSAACHGHGGILTGATQAELIPEMAHPEAWCPYCQDASWRRSGGDAYRIAAR